VRARSNPGRWAKVLGFAVLAASAPARAAELLIAAPSACAIGDELSFRAERALGQSLESAAEVRCTVHISRAGGAYAARLDVSPVGSPQRSSQRLFSAPSCDQLTETLALAVSLAIGAGTAEETAEEAAEEAAREGLPSTAAVSPAPAADDSVAGRVEGAHAVDTPLTLEDRGESGGLRFGALAALVADAGTLPGVGMGASLGAALGVGAFDLRLLGTYLPPRDVSVDGSSAGAPGAEIELLAGSLLACAPRLLQAYEVQLGACGGAELGWLEGTGTGVDISRSGVTGWSAARGDATARWALGRGLGLDLQLSVLVPLERDEFTVAGAGRVYRPGRAAGRATLGLSIELGSSAGLR
jgi:hypothetical protein